MDPLRTVMVADILVDTDGRIAALVPTGQGTLLLSRSSSPCAKYSEAVAFSNRSCSAEPNLNLMRGLLL